MNTEKPVDPAGSVGIITTPHEVPAELTQEGLEAAALRVPADADLDKAADSVIADITGGAKPDDEETGDDIP